MAGHDYLAAWLLQSQFKSAGAAMLKKDGRAEI
jgi:hypothetical protein